MDGLDEWLADRYLVALFSYRGQYSDAVLNELESQNDQQVEGILGKVKVLKEVSFYSPVGTGHGKEARGQQGGTSRIPVVESAKTRRKVLTSSVMWGSDNR